MRSQDELKCLASTIHTHIGVCLVAMAALLAITDNKRERRARQRSKNTIGSGDINLMNFTHLPPQPKQTRMLISFKNKQIQKSSHGPHTVQSHWLLKIKCFQIISSEIGLLLISWCNRDKSVYHQARLLSIQAQCLVCKIESRCSLISLCCQGNYFGVENYEFIQRTAR